MLQRILPVGFIAPCLPTKTLRSLWALSQAALSSRMTCDFAVFRLFRTRFFERSDPNLKHLTRLGHRICAIVQGTAQFDSKLAAFSDTLH